MIKVIGHNHFIYYLRNYSDFPKPFFFTNLHEAAFAIIDNKGALIKEPEDWETIFDKVLITVNERGYFDIFKIVIDDDSFYIPGAVMKEFANSRIFPICQFASVQIAGASIVKCRYDLRDILEQYFKKVNEENA